MIDLGTKVFRKIEICYKCLNVLNVIYHLYRKEIPNNCIRVIGITYTGSKLSNHSSVLTRVSFAQRFNLSWHLLFTNSFIFLSLCCRFETLPRERAEVKVHEDVTQGFQIIATTLFYNERSWVSWEIILFVHRKRAINLASKSFSTILSTTRIARLCQNLIGQKTISGLPEIKH